MVKYKHKDVFSFFFISCPGIQSSLVHPPSGGNHHHLHQDLLPLEEEKDAKPLTGEEAEKNKYHSNVNICHILYKVQNTYFVTFHSFSFVLVGCLSVSFVFLLSCLTCLMIQVGTTKCGVAV